MIIVTGGAGFIGSNIVHALEVHRNQDLVVVDRLGTGDKWRNIAKRALADLIPPERLFDFLGQHGGSVSAIVHMGAISATTEVDGDRIVENNLRLSLDLWDWCTKHQTPFIYASSAATYGDGRQGFDDDSSPEALAKLQPLNLYGWSKHVFDRRVVDLARQGSYHRPPQWAGLKFFNVYGPNEEHKGPQRSVVSQIYRRLADGHDDAVLFKSHHPDYGDGGQLRDFIWVDDCVAVVLWLLDNPGVSGLFNLGTGKARSFADLARAVFRAMNKPERITFVPTPESIRDKYQYFTQAGMGRLRAAGYERPFTPLEAGVGCYVRDFLMAPDPYR